MTNEQRFTKTINAALDRGENVIIKTFSDHGRDSTRKAQKDQPIGTGLSHRYFDGARYAGSSVVINKTLNRVLVPIQKDGAEILSVNRKYHKGSVYFAWLSGEYVNGIRKRVTPIF